MTSDFERALERALEEGRPTLRDLAALSGPSREESQLFVSRLREVDDARRRSLLERMVRSAEERFELDFDDLMRPLLSDPDPTVRRYAVEGLWEYERADLVEPLLCLLSTDPDALVRAAAAVSLGRFLFMAECDELDKPLAAEIEEGLRAAAESADEDVEVRRRALESIAYINGERWVYRLIDEAYVHTDMRMRQSALFAMGRNGERLWAETVLAELHNEHPAMRYEAARACGELGLRRAVEPLIRLLEDVDSEVQQIAVWALGQIGGKRARSALEACVEHGDEALGAAASDALEEIEFADRPLDLLVFEPEDLGLQHPGEGQDLHDAIGDDADDYGDDAYWDDDWDDHDWHDSDQGTNGDARSS